MSGFVYAIECSGRVKIGFSMQPAKRLSKIASDAPFPCRLLGYWPGSEADELAIHEKFQDTRVHGEWFAATEALMHFIAGRKIDLPAEALDARKPVDLCGFLVHRGAKRELAEALGITSGAISQWTQVPPNRAIAVERLTGISRHDLCPDVFGPATSQEKVA